jgi:hypothetical protein
MVPEQRFSAPIRIYNARMFFFVHFAKEAHGLNLGGGRYYYFDS